MKLRHLCCAVAGMFVLLANCVARAQEVPPATDASASTDSPYEQLAKSKDRAAALLAQRYLKLVRLQDWEWTKTSGKVKISARYVAHDPNLQWVKLAAVMGSGKTRVVKEGNVDVAKLSKSCQTRVRQIDLLQKKLDELNAKAPTDGEAGQAGSEGYGEQGAPMIDERGVEPRLAADNLAANVPPTEPPSPGPIGANADSADTAPGADSEDPLGFAEVELGPAPDASGLPVFPSAGGFSVPVVTEGTVEQAPWRTSYADFVANLSVAASPTGEPAVRWGELRELEQVNAMADTMGSPEFDMATFSEASKRLGQVRWQLDFLQMEPSEDGGMKPQFQVQELPQPLEIKFELADPQSAPDWTALPPGTTADVVGQLTIEQPNKITVRVRLAQPTDGPSAGGASSPSAAADERR